MSLKVQVEDRVSTYPGRVRLTPVPGKTDVYDMVRADEPIAEGTPINKVLFDSKCDTLTRDVTIYVSTGGDDTNGTGNVDSPFRTIQKAIDLVPKHLGGHIATIDIESGTYEERIVVNGFSGGQLVIGVYGRSTLVRGIDIDNSSLIVTNISKITYADGFNGNLFDVDGASNVLVSQGITIDGTNGGLISCFYARNNSVVSASSGNSVTVQNAFGGIDLAWGATIALSRVYGQGLFAGITVGTGCVFSCESNSITSDLGNEVSAGGRMFIGGGVVNFVTATIE